MLSVNTTSTEMRPLFKPSYKRINHDEEEKEKEDSSIQFSSVKSAMVNNPFLAYEDQTSSSIKLKRRLIFVSTIILLLIISFHSLSSRDHQILHAPHHPSFTVLQSSSIAEYNAEMFLYEHKLTKAQFLAHIPNNNNKDIEQDKVFAVGFRTIPQNNNGVAHILEHSVLNGSQKFPIKDPFLHMRKGSLSTYLNAMTYNDRTVFPIASRNEKDFRNLMNVYLDAVFHPKCVEVGGEWILSQEGWHYDAISDNDLMGDDDKFVLEVKGVVYNEMKGAFSNPEAISQTETMKLLFPDSPYQFVSGGDPSAIKELTIEEFVDFYKRHYHPTNSKLFISGTSDDVVNGMELIHEYLREFEYERKTRDESVVPFQRRKFTRHINHSVPYAVDKFSDTAKGQHMFTMTWLLNEINLECDQELALLVLDYLLIDNKTSPLHKALTESHLGNDITGYGLQTGLLQRTFAVGMKGVRATEISKLEDLIMATLENLSRIGFEKEAVSAAMHRIEFNLRDVSSMSDVPLGISFFLQAMTKWNYDLPPASALIFEDALQKLKGNVKTHGSIIFQNLIVEYLLHNEHRVHLTLRPSATLESEMLNKEKMDIQTALSKNSYKDILAQANELKRVQQTEDLPEDISKLPSLSIEDINRNNVEYPLEVRENIHDSGITLLKNPVATSFGIIHVDICVDLSTSVKYEDVQLLPFLVMMMRETGTIEYDDVKQSRLIDMHTGGISTELFLEPIVAAGQDAYTVRDDENFSSLLVIRGKCVTEKSKMMLELVLDILQKAKLDWQDKALQILDREINHMLSDIQSSGHVYAVRRMQGRYDVVSFIKEQWKGVSQLRTLKQLLEQAKNNWPIFKNRMEKMRQQIVASIGSGSVVNLTGESKAMSQMEKQLKNILRTNQSSKVDRVIHPWHSLAKAEMEDIIPIQNEGIVVPSQVSYVAKGGLLYNPNEVISGSTDVVLQYLEKGYLWHNVREQQGAYGVMVGLNSMTGTIYMASYRDPQISMTVETYDATADSIYNDLKSNSIKNVVNTAIIGSIGSIDGTAVLPARQGLISLARWLSGRTPEHRQKWREGILNTKESDFTDFANRLKNWRKPSIAIVGSEHTLQTSNLVMSYILPDR